MAARPLRDAQVGFEVGVDRSRQVSGGVGGRALIGLAQVPAAIGEADPRVPQEG